MDFCSSWSDEENKEYLDMVRQRKTEFCISRGIPVPSFDKVDDFMLPDIPTNKDGFCPWCGELIDFFGPYKHDYDGKAVLNWECPQCGTHGKTEYSLVFSKHFDIKNKNGHQINV